MLPIAHQVREQILEYQRVIIAILIIINRLLIKRKECNITIKEGITHMEVKEVISHKMFLD
jgi:hypothetical protein